MPAASTTTWPPVAIMVTPNANACSGLPGNTWVRVDATRQQGLARRVDDRGVRRCEIRPDVDDHAVAHQHRHPGPQVVAVEQPIGPDQQHVPIVPAGILSPAG